MLFAAPAANVVVPATLTLPLSVIAPPAVTFSLPETVDAPRSVAVVSLVQRHVLAAGHNDGSNQMIRIV